MDPNDPNNQNSLTDPTAGTMPQQPVADINSNQVVNEPAPNLSLDNLYGPSTPEDLAAAVPGDSIQTGDGSVDPALDYNAAQEADPYADPNAPVDPPSEYSTDYEDPPQDADSDAVDTQYYQPEDDTQVDPNAVQLDPNGAPPAAGTSSLPPVPTKSKAPIFIIAIGVVLVLGMIVGVMVFALRSRGTSGATASPVPVEEEIYCSDEPNNPDCIEKPLESEEPLASEEPIETEEPIVTATPLPTQSTPARPSLTPQRCQLLYGGPCP